MKLLKLILLLIISYQILFAVKFINYTTYDGLLSNRINCITIDKNGDKWFGTDTCVSKFDGSSWTNYPGVVFLDRIYSAIVENPGRFD